MENINLYVSFGHLFLSSAVIGIEKLARIFVILLIYNMFNGLSTRRNNFNLFYKISVNGYHHFQSA